MALKKVKSGVTLVTEDDYLPVLLKLLARARSHIDILAFSFAIGSARGKLDLKGAPYKIAQALARLKERHGDGLTIRLFIEGRRETADRNRVTAEFLKKAGVKVRYGATHAKGVCVDGKLLLIGSTNFTGQSLLRNNETNVLLKDSAAVSEFERYFDFKWEGGEHGELELNPPLIADGGFLPVLVEMIETAKTRLEFSIYFFSLSPVEKALIRAHKRGVKITGFVGRHNAFALSYVRRTEATVKRLRAAGISDLHFDQGHLFTHSKYLIKDRKEVALGTGNWLLEDVVEHPQLYVHLKDPALAKELARHLALQIAEQASGR